MTVMVPPPFRILALGDSYTIGEGVAPAERWPVLLVARLRERGVDASDPVIVARTGWTAAELADGIRAAEESGELLGQGPGGTPRQGGEAGPREGEVGRGSFDCVTLLVGVNDQYRGGGAEEFRAPFRAVLATAVRLAGGDPRRVVVLTIPDWGVTPFAGGRDREGIARAIDAFNGVVMEEAAALGTHRVDVAPLTRGEGADAGWLAGDGLHPSGRMYVLWARRALPSVLAVVEARATETGGSGRP